MACVSCPVEIKSLILDNLTAEEARTCRSISRAWEDVATEHGFRRLQVSHQKRHNSHRLVSGYGIARTAQTFSKKVQYSIRELSIDIWRDYPDYYLASLLQLVRDAPRLRRLAIEYKMDGNCMQNTNSELPQFILRYLPDQSTIQSLKFRNFPTTSMCDIGRCLDPQSLATSLDELELGLAATRFDDSAQSYYYDLLPKVFLQPFQHRLTRLVLCSDKPWAFYPSCRDLYKLKFPMLRDLALTHHIFFHQEQVDWISAHTNLIRLSVLNCHILVSAHSIEYDDEGYPTGVTPNYTAGTDREFSLRWETVYETWRRTLMKLKRFHIIDTIFDDGVDAVQSVPDYVLCYIDTPSRTTYFKTLGSALTSQWAFNHEIGNDSDNEAA